MLCMRQIQHFWIFWSIILLLYHLFKIGQALCWTMVSSCKKCSDILKDGLLAELQARTSRSCRFCCFFTSYIAGILNRPDCWSYSLQPILISTINSLLLPINKFIHYTVFWIPMDMLGHSFYFLFSVSSKVWDLMLKNMKIRQLQKCWEHS